MSEASRKVPPEVDDDLTNLKLYRGITLKDLLVLAPGIFLMFFTVYFTPRIIFGQMMFLSILLLCGSTLVLLLTPEIYTPLEWLLVKFRNRVDPNEWHHIEHQSSNPNREQKDMADHTGLSNFATDERTQDLLGINRITTSEDHPGAIEIRDGTLIGAVEVSPPNLSLGTEREWNNVIDSLASLINTLDYRTEIVWTNRMFDVEKLLLPYERRLSDQDIKNNPLLEEMLILFIETYRGRIEEDNARITEHYIVTGAKRSEARSRRRSEAPVDKIPVVSSWFGTDNEEELSEAVIRGRQREILRERLKKIRSGVQDIEGVEGEIADAEQHAELVSRAWKRENSQNNISEQLGNGIPTRKRKS